MHFVAALHELVKQSTKPQAAYTMVGMRWSIIRLIWLRELRDQLRDRRTLFMVAGLPVLLYPILGVAVLKFAVGFVDRKTIVGLVNGPHQPHEFPPPQPSYQTAVQTVGWLTQPPGLAQATSAAALAHLPPRPTSGWSAIPPTTAVAALAPGGVGADQLAAATLAAFSHFAYDYPLLARSDRFMIDGAPPALLGDSKLQIVWLDTPDRHLLTSRKIDVLLGPP